jgi:ComF family protein
VVNKYRNALQGVLDGLFPSYCELCDLPTPGALPLCDDCRAELPGNPQACTRCALPLPTDTMAGATCGQCLASAPAFDRTLAPYLYEEYLAFLVTRWKYRRQPQLSALLADLWLSATSPAADIDLLVPVPLHWRRAWRRGYNQAALLCDALLHRRPTLSARGVDPRLLRRTRATAPQQRLDADARRSNLRGAFTATRPCDSLIIALVDDVMTTGATADAAARTLLAAGARRVDLWCLARTPSPGDPYAADIDHLAAGPAGTATGKRGVAPAGRRGGQLSRDA